jgi:hypothetical protein
MVIGSMPMNKPNFSMMTKKELRAYTLSHREDKEAFYAYLDKMHSEARWIRMPSSKSINDVEKHPDFLEYLRNSSK